MIRSSGVNQLINDLITRIERSTTFVDDICTQSKWENTNQVTIYDFQRDDTSPNTNSANNSNSNPTNPLTSTTNPSHQYSGLEQDAGFPALSVQQHHKRVLESKSFNPSDVDHVHSDQIYLPQSFNVTMDTLEGALRQGSILSYYQHRIATYAREISDLFPEIDTMLREATLLVATPTSQNIDIASTNPSSGPSISTSNLPVAHTNPQYSVQQHHQQLLQHQQQLRALPVAFSHLHDHAHLISAYIAFKSHIFYFFEQWGLCRDKFICNLRNDTVRDELFQLLYNDYNKLSEWIHKFKEFYTFCKKGADSSQRCLQQQENLRNQQHFNAAASHPHLHPNPSNSFLPGLNNNPSFSTDFMPGDSLPLCYHVQITAPTTERSYDTLGIKLELKCDSAGKYHITIRNYGAYCVKILEALFTLLDDDGASIPIDEAHNYSIMTDEDHLHEYDTMGNGTPLNTMQRIDRRMSQGSLSSTSHTTPPQGAAVPPKHPLLRNDWLDIITVDKPLTPFPQRQQNLLNLQRVRSIHEVAPSFICFSFDSPNQLAPGADPTDPKVIAQRLHKYTHYHPGYPEELKNLLKNDTSADKTKDKSDKIMQDESKYNELEKSTASSSSYLNSALTGSVKMQSYLCASFLCEVSLAKP